MKYQNPTDCPYYLITRVSLVVTSALKKGFAEAGVDQIKPAYIGALWVLWQEDGLMVSELGRRAGLEPSTMTGLVDRMQRDGITERRPDPNDRRVQRIFLTPSGQKMRQPVIDTVDGVINKVFGKVPQEALDVTTRLLRQVLAKAQEGSHTHESNQCNS